MARGKAAAIDLTETERGELDGLLRRHGTAQALALRVRIVLLAAEGLTNGAIAAGLGIDEHTVGKWRNRFAAARSTACTTSRGRGHPGGSATTRSPRRSA